MRKALFMFLVCGLTISVNAQKKNKSKDKTNYEYTDSLPPPPAKSSKKGKETTKTTNYDKNDKKGKDNKKGKKGTSVNYKEPESEPAPVADSSKKFIGVIKYRMTSDDPSDRDSIFIIFGERQIRVTMFTPGYREGQVFETNTIANFSDSSFIELDVRNMTYTKEKLGARNEGAEFTLANSKKTGPVMNITCQEYKGEMISPDGDEYEAACLVSSQYQYLAAMDYNFMNIQPLVKGYKIVLGFRTKSPENENTYIIAYKIEPRNTDSYFDLSGYQAK